MTSARARRNLTPYLPRVRTLAGAKVLLALLLHANGRGEAWPSGKVLARVTGLSRRRVWAGLQELETLGAIERVPAGRGRVNLYRVVTQETPPIVSHASLGSAPRSTGVVTPGALPLSVTPGALPDAQKPRDKRVSAQGGAQPDSVSGDTLNKEQLKEQRREQPVSFEEQPPAAAPPASSTASGAAASGLGGNPSHHPGTGLGEKLFEVFLEAMPFARSVPAALPGVSVATLNEAHRWLTARAPDAAEQFAEVVWGVMGGQDRWPVISQSLRKKGYALLGSGRLTFILERGDAPDLSRVWAAWSRILEYEASRSGRALHEVPR